jgi:aryl-alcohol dehydrogenase-like predicted oxidoreductase
MENILLPNGLSVAPACLGAMNFGTSTSKEDAFKVLDAYIDAGGNFVDTSNNYAHWAGTGDESETVLGEYFKQRGNRDKIILATKVGFDRHGKGAGLKKEQIEYWIDESLRKMNTDYVDIYYSHNDDVNTPLEESLEAFDRLVKKGKVRVLGGSNYDTWRFAEVNSVAKENGFTPYTIMQQRFTYLNVSGDYVPKYIFNEPVNRERLRYLYAKDIPLVAYSCLAKGGYDVPERMPAEHLTGDRLEAVKTLAAEKNVNTGAIVVAYLTNFHRINGMPRVIPLFASSRVSHFLDNLRGTDINLTDSELEALYKA